MEYTLLMTTLLLLGAIVLFRELFAPVRPKYKQRRF